jgi:hypothetical protein
MRQIKAVLTRKCVSLRSDLNDLDRGNYDCQHGNQAREEESDAYYTGYGARYVYEQMANHHSEGANQ